MSGIFGIYSLTGRPVDAGHLAGMRLAMADWGPHGSAVWRDAAIGLGHLKLNNTPESLHETLPVKSRSGNCVLTAAARLDNRDDLCQILNVPAADRSVTTDSDLILKAWKKWGRDCPRQLLGDWSFAIWDGANQTLFIARDHFGHAGLYYYRHRDVFVFASAVSAVLAAPGVPCEFNQNSLLQLTPGHPRDDTTPYRDVLRLTPASSLTVTQHHMTRRRYWSPAEAADVRFRSDDEYVEALRDVYTTAVRCRMRSCNSVGVTLSGGLDSGSTAALAARESGRRGQRLTGITAVPKFNTADTDGRTQFGDERPFVELLSRHCHNIDVAYVTADDVSPLEGMRHVVRVSGDPFPSPGNSFWLCGIMKEAARLGIGTLLTGQAGNFTVSWAGNRDEYLASLLRSGRLLQYTAEIRAWAETHNASLARVLTNQVARSVIPANLVRQFRRRRAGKHPTAMRQQFLNSLQSVAARTDLPELKTMHPNSARRKLTALMRSDCNAAWNELGAAFGVNVAAPAIDVRVIEFCLGIPQDQYTRHGQRKLLLRRAMHGLMPREVLWNERKGRQSGDIVYRVRQHRDEFDAVLTELQSSSLATEILDLPQMADVFTRIQTDINPQLSRSTVIVLLKGVMIGLFLQMVEAKQRPQMHVARAA